MPEAPHDSRHPFRKQPAGELHPTPAVVGMDRKARHDLEVRQQWLRAWRYVLIAIVLHGAGFLYWWSRPSEALLPPDERMLMATLDDPPPPEPEPLEELLPPEMKPPEPPPLDDPEMEDPTLDEEETELDQPYETDPNILGLGGAQGVGGRGGRRSGLAGPSAPELGSGPTGTGFRNFVTGLRTKGMDVVFVVDATASMEKFIELTRATIDEIIGELGAIVPDLRLGLTAYRDRGDQWLTQQVPLTDDRYAIHNFLIDLEASGGGDFEEAVEEGLRVAIEGSGWRPAARHVMILVGDAPPHEDDEQKAIGMVRTFARGKDAAVSVLFTGSQPGKKPTEREENARAVFERISRSGGGLLAELITEEAELRDRILDASFGVEWRDEIRALLGQRGGDWRDRIVQKKVADGDRKWLMQNLSDTPVHPAVVDGCVRLFDRRIAERALSLLTDETESAGVRSVALYVLKKSIARTVAIDVTKPLTGQTAALAALKREVERLPKPPPAPPSGGSRDQR
ncbi:MAG: vWA domain-containing protein [Planctomycetota bacterium]|jgi:hypothetical protein